MIGVVLEVLGWYGVSGQSVVARQLPYIASGSIPGAALMIAGTMVAVRRSSESGRRIAELHAALIESAPPEPGREAAALAAEAGPAPQALLAVPDGTTFHRPSCALVAGKAEAVAVSTDEIAARGLRPCPVCEPNED